MDKAVSGIQGLDEVLQGGYPLQSAIIVEGEPGTGKTTLGFQFLYHGIILQNEPGLYITFEEFPEQLYKNMKQFGWDLKELERKNKLRVICVSPQLFVEQMTAHQGLLDRWVAEIGAKRLVLDSISLLRGQSETENESRQLIYAFMNALKRHGLTSLLLREKESNDNIYPFENYLTDGIVHLSLQALQEKYRKRVLEVKKMRGVAFREGEHIYKITSKGIYLIPSLCMNEDVLFSEQQNYLSTGLPILDRLLGGGIPEGSVFIFDTNSKANYKNIFNSILISQVRRGGQVITHPSSVVSIIDIRRNWLSFGIDLSEPDYAEKILFVEYYFRDVPLCLEKSVVHFNQNTRSSWQEQWFQLFQERNLAAKGHLLAYLDINALLCMHGQQGVEVFFTEISAYARNSGITLIALCNFSEVGKNTQSFLERTSNGVIRTWVDGMYQFLQVTKTPHGLISEPYIVESISEIPYVQLV
jgi:circadian clock protein KaiC